MRIVERLYRDLMRRGPALAAVAAIAAAMATVAEGAAAPTLSARVSPKPVLLGNHARVEGQLSTHQAGVGVVLETSRFPFSSGFKQIRKTTTGASGDYVFVFRPTLHTRVRVRRESNPSVQSNTPSAYVVGGFSDYTCTIRKAGKNHKCSEKNLNGDLTLKISYRRSWPASAYDTESAKQVYVYFGLRKGSSKPPDTVELKRKVSQRRLGNNRTEVTASQSFHAPSNGWASQLATCIKFTPAKDGVGLFGDHHCGDQTVTHKQATNSNSFG